MPLAGLNDPFHKLQMKPNYDNQNDVSFLKNK